jgi:DnaJ-class molecular chaperone
MEGNFKIIKMEKNKNITKTLFGESKVGYQKCKTCGGTGSLMRYPYYATIMPEKRLIPCEDCGGHGQIYVVPNNIKIAREGDL